MPTHETACCITINFGKPEKKWKPITEMNVFPECNCIAQIPIAAHAEGFDCILSEKFENLHSDQLRTGTFSNFSWSSATKTEQPF